MMSTSTSTAQADLEATIARTALKYDLLPYDSNPFPQSIPARTGGLARLFGIAAAPMAQARVLELGCAAGGNIIPLALRYPEARFVGVDLSRTQVAAGRARIGGLGLKNIEILCQSFTELGEAVGDFDYIICHGVYSWVPAPVRSAILQICRERLAPNGVAYISYNVLPGWRMMQALRDAFQIAVPDQLDSRARVTQARNFVSLLRAHSPQAGAYAEMLKTWDERLKTLPEDYIAHEFLEEINDPCTVKDFVAGAQVAGLAYLGDTDLPSMILDNQPAQAAARIREVAGSDLVGTEQMLDLISGRTFRQSLLVRAERNAEISRSLDGSRLETMHFAAGPDLVAAATDTGGTVTDGAGRQLTTTAPAVLSALEGLIRRYPATSSIEEMLAGLSAAQRKSHGDMVREAVLRMVVVGLLTPLSEPVLAQASAGTKPTACRLARLDAARGETSTANLRHERVIIDPAARALLPVMDGTRDRAALVAHFAGEALAGKITFNENGAPVMDEPGIRRLADQAIDGALAGVARAALIVPS